MERLVSALKVCVLQQIAIIMHVETNNCCPFLWYNNEVFCIVLAERAKLQRLQLDSAVCCRKELNIESIRGVDVTVFVFYFCFY